MSADLCGSDARIKETAAGGCTACLSIRGYMRPGCSQARCLEGQVAEFEPAASCPRVHVAAGSIGNGTYVPAEAR